jgi:co-chaperonin GroES (HSP10)
MTIHSLDRLAEEAAPRSLRDFKGVSLNNRCIVKLDPLPEKSSLIKLTDEEIVTLSGIVLSVGPKVIQPLLGQRVHFHKYYGIDLYFKGEMLKAVNEEDLLLVEPKEAESLENA